MGCLMEWNGGMDWTGDVEYNSNGMECGNRQSIKVPLNCVGVGVRIG